MLTVTLFLLSFAECVGKLTYFCDDDGGSERGVAGWCDMFEFYSDCVGIGVRSGGWKMYGLGVVFNKSSF